MTGNMRALTWLPNTPAAVAVDNSLGANHWAAKCGGTPRMNTCDHATSVCPANAHPNPVGPTPSTFIHEPTAVPAQPTIIAHLKPCFEKIPEINMSKITKNQILLFDK
jgi:hypothetical protein